MSHSSLKKARKEARKPKAIKAWAGVVDGKLHYWNVSSTVPYYEIYRRKDVAEQHYEKVVRVEIRPL